MHELSIAMQIVESVTGAIDPAETAPVTAVNVRVGALSGVIPEALRFAWDVAVDGSRLTGAALNIEEVPAVVWCPNCNSEVELPGFTMRCPICDTPTPRVVRGKELDILSLELADEPTTPNP